MRRAVLFGLAMSGLASLPSPAGASGFAVNEQGARGTAMGGAVTALSGGPSTLFYNPAGLVRLQGLGLELGLTLLGPATTFRGEDPVQSGVKVEVEAERPASLLPLVFASFSLADSLAVGVGIYSPFSASIQWPDRMNTAGGSGDFWGREASRRISLSTLYINPAVAVKVHERVHLGLGLAVALASLTLERAVTQSASVADDVDFKMSGQDASFCATAGLLVSVLPGLLDLGVAYRGGADLHLEGSGAFTRGGSGAAVPDSLRSVYMDGPVEVDLPLPHVISLGVGVFPLEGLSLGFALDVVTWSGFRGISLHFPQNKQLDSDGGGQWVNSFSLRLGAEFLALGGDLPLRLGLGFERGPVPEAALGPDLPDADRYQLSLGAGYRFWVLEVDLAYQYTAGSQLKSADTGPLPGAYRTDIHLLGVSLGARLDVL